MKDHFISLLCFLTMLLLAIGPYACRVAHNHNHDGEVKTTSTIDVAFGVCEDFKEDKQKQECREVILKILQEGCSPEGDKVK